MTSVIDHYRIRRLLKERGLTARQASLAISDNPYLLRDILKGKSQNPRADTMQKLVALLGEDLTVTHLQGSRREAFKAWLAAQALKVPDVARRSGVPATTLYSFINGQAGSLLASTEAQVATAFHTTADAVFGGARQGSDEQIASTLRQARKARGLSQQVLAEHLGLAQSVISDWETGQLQSWREHEARLCESLALPPLCLSRLVQGQASPAAKPAPLEVSEVNDVLAVWAQIAPQDRPRALAVLKAFAAF